MERTIYHKSSSTNVLCDDDGDDDDNRAPENHVNKIDIVELNKRDYCTRERY